jgi:small GTP-binding protein
MQEYKIVVLGPMGAGKSTLVQALAGGRAVNTEVRNSDPGAQKEFTTVAMDYGDIPLPGGDRLRLYGTPGQLRFSFLWPILLEGASGAIVLVDATTDTTRNLAINHLDAIAGHSPHLPVVIGLTKQDTASVSQVSDCEHWLQSVAPMLPAIPVDPRKPQQVLTVMDVLMSQIECQSLVDAHE